MLEIGNMVRPAGKSHDSTTWIGEIIAIRDTCECCHQAIARRITVRWPDGREGGWSDQSLAFVASKRD